MADTEKKITQTDMFNEIIGLATEAGRDDIVEFCKDRIEKIAAKAEKSKEAREKKKEASDEMRDAIAQVLTTEGQTPEEIANILGGDATKNKVSSRMKALIESGVAVKDKNEDGKVIYKLA